ncbi:hypothetical protein H632_c218p0 [Helicosporidium sp. ATCC 50920]|nr:hypothetical protein H632_c218p0 [Helicosporidium sp. ATCC 50920]|eukprot:KDD76458.1 hypothetical protein H632_c218p0 [Helicosporidium sp. ATCC 50920]
MTFINPRGKHTIAFYDDDFVIQTSRGHIAVPYSAISHVLILDSLPKDTKDRVILFMHLNGTLLPRVDFMHACKISSAPPESEEESGSEGEGDDEDEDGSAADSDDEDEDATFNPASSSDSQGDKEDDDEEDANSVEVVSEEGFTRNALDSLLSEEQTSKRQRKA